MVTASERQATCIIAHVENAKQMYIEREGCRLLEAVPLFLFTFIASIRKQVHKPQSNSEATRLIGKKSIVPEKV